MSINEDDSPIIEEIIGKLSDVPAGTKKIFQVRDRKILVINDENKLYAINGLCSHYNFPLENGVYAKGRIRCPLHGACFNVKSGDIEDYPGFDSLHSYQVDVKGDDILIKTTENELASDRRVRRLPPNLIKCEDRPIIVIGGGISTASFIEHSRLNGLTTPIIVVSDESLPSYDKVLLSKKPSAQGNDIRLRSDEFYSERNVEFILNTSVTEVNTNKRHVTLSNGNHLIYSRLVIATGGNVRKLNVPGSDLENIHYVRKIEEANAINEKHVGKHVVVVGSSFIGMEIASFLVAEAASVTVVSNSAEPLPVFGEDIGRSVRNKFIEKGVRFELNTSVQELFGAAGKVEQVTLQNGKQIAADLVVCGIGVTPATEFLKNTRIELDERGFIRVDEKFRTNVNYISAIGDVVSFPLPLWNIDHINIQHFQTAQCHGQLLGYSIVGKPHPRPIVPYFWTLFFFAFGLKFSGCTQGSTKHYDFGEIDSLNFVRYYLKKDRVVAVATGGPSTVAVQFAEIFLKGIEVTLKDLKNSKDHEWTHLLKFVDYCSSANSKKSFQLDVLK